MSEKKFSVRCKVCKKIMKKVKKHLGNHENAVSDKHRTIGERKKLVP